MHYPESAFNWLCVVQSKLEPTIAAVYIKLMMQLFVGRPDTVRASSSMTYAVKEIFKTLQGEGAHSGRTAVFCRFAGCNLWTGREEDRASATCTFCDTDFVGTDGSGGGKFETPEKLAEAITRAWGDRIENQINQSVNCSDMAIFTAISPAPRRWAVRRPRHQ